jgi:Xaa-Pro aminopeptidase
MFPRAEYERRVVRARGAMAAQDVDLLLVDHAELLAWLTGYTISEAMYRAAFLPREGEPWFVLRELDADLCRRAVWFNDVVGFKDTDDPHVLIAQSISARGFAAARIGADFQSYGFTAATHRRLEALLPHAEFVDMPRASDRLRAVKSAAEIEVLARAAAIADAAMTMIVANARPGFTARRAAAIAAAAFIEQGADSGDTGPILRSGGDHEFLHGAPTAEPLCDGDILHVELIPKVANYSARLMRPILIGQDRDGLRQIAERMIALQDRQIAAMRPGAIARDVDAVLREPMRAEGLRSRYDNVSGYALGLYARTSRLSDFSYAFLPTADWRLEENMVFHMYASARGLGFSETVLVSREGGVRLTQIPRRLLGGSPSRPACAPSSEQ